MSSIIQVGFLQTQPEFGAVEENLNQVKNLWGDHKANLLVLPELFNTGYQFQSLAEARIFPNRSLTDPRLSFWWTGRVNQE